MPTHDLVGVHTHILGTANWLADVLSRPAQVAQHGAALDHLHVHGVRRVVVGPRLSGYWRTRLPFGDNALPVF